ncbi:14726_t:CDS:2 [Dentiscutata erythropus]|uniref:14726_t:CDS:1 n=1 Tax=Dentiscutata erythropus TaxID=1348616 RepID=A0A9N9GZG1_9GLOM|nr:14726_t:CDS:2 [Dentiscutata erythropus]
MSNNISGFSSSKPYLRTYNERQEEFMILTNFSFTNFNIDDLNIDNYFDFYNGALTNPFNNNQTINKFTQLIQKQHGVDREVMQYKHQDDEKYECSDENNDLVIQFGATFSNWNSLENALKGNQYENDVADMVKWLMKQQEQEPR